MSHAVTLVLTPEQVEALEDVRRGGAEILLGSVIGHGICGVFAFALKDEPLADVTVRLGVKP